MPSADDLIQRALIASGTPVRDFPDAERRAMQRRIKHQRRELKRLNTSNRALQMLVRTFSNKMAEERRHGYRHAAQMAESFHYWPFGKRIAAYIRKWL